MTTTLFSLEGKTALVTGGNGGLGLTMAQGLKSAGARVVVTGRNPEKNAAATAAADAPDLVCSMDVYDERSVERTVAQIVEKFGELNILINNAGVGKRSVVTDLSWKSGRTPFTST